MNRDKHSSAERYAVIGNPIAHSQSPRIHKLFAQAHQIELRYDALTATPDDFFATVESFREQDGRGLNVTSPFKLEAYRLPRKCSDRARLAEAVNTLTWQGKEWHGDNTDGIGLVTDLESNLNFPLKGKDILLIGAGGATRGVLGPLLAAQPNSVMIANRTAQKAVELASLFSEFGSVDAAAIDDLFDRVFDLVINATSASLASTDTRPLDLAPDLLATDALAYEMAYGQGETTFLRWARLAGAARISDGLGMLVEQAAESFYIWHGVRPHTAPVLAALREEVAVPAA